jgi:hypothetical protein
MEQGCVEEVHGADVVPLLIEKTELNNVMKVFYRVLVYSLSALPTV